MIINLYALQPGHFFNRMLTGGLLGVLPLLAGCSHQSVPQALRLPQPKAALAQKAKARFSSLPTSAPTGMADVLADVRRRSFFLVPTPGTPRLLADNYAQRLVARFEPTAYTVGAAPDSGATASAWEVR
ncbi:hypothetical protein [Hymenobacter negativus]|uniref:Uncharacterized protein n=1 Tax=Hymenobacter negativus TaxID=2795026 RepID=A0ABS3QGH6_9BACT|nr:hypothetical protein [Hymenobacter negativus]MBO2010350.1 hypothetical protein [Hymenobacter negativus]